MNRNRVALVALATILLFSSPRARAQSPQPYPNATTDRFVHPKTPMLPPAVNVPFTDPNFGSPMVRATDKTTNFKLPGTFLRTEASGAQNVWSADSRKFYVIGKGGQDLAFGFDPSTMTISSLPSAQPGKALLIPLRPGPTFSFIDPDLVYGTTNRNPLTISSYRFSTGIVTPVIDTTTCGLQPPPHPGSRGDDDVATSADDSRLSISEIGPQVGHDDFVVVYDKSLGCRWYNTQTGQIRGQWGATGTAVGPKKGYYVQHARLSRSGNYIRIQVAHSGSYIWNVATLNVTPCTYGLKLECLGYGAVGYNSYVNDSGFIDEMNIIKRPLGNLAQFTPLVWPLPAHHHWGQEHHFSWNNVDVNDSTPVCASSYNYEGDPRIRNAYDGEIFCLETDGIASTIWRFAHNRAIWIAPYFNTQPLGNVSMDGRFFLFTSSWDGQLGVEADGTPRSDVWIVKLD